MERRLMSLGRRAAATTIILTAGVLLGLLFIFSPRATRAYIEAPMSLAAIIAQSTNILLLQVESVDRQQNIIEFRKLKDLKGRHPNPRLSHQIGRAGFHPREWQAVMGWAKEGELAVLFHNGGASETCIDTYWYQCYGGGQHWSMNHGEPYLLRSYAGRPEKLSQLVEGILRGEEVIVPCMVDGDKNELALRRARIQRLRAALGRQDYDPERDFVGWGSEDLEVLEGMPGFSHVATLPRVDPDAVGVSSADYDGDAKLDVCLFGPARTALLHNEGKSFVEVSLPSPAGARAAAWADHDGDGHLDLLLATPGGPRLLGGTGQGDSFRDDSSLLPELPAWNVTSAAWIDADADGWPDIIVANGFYGLRLFRNARGRRLEGRADAAEELVGFTDAGPIPSEWPRSAPNGGLAGVKGDHFVIGDVNGDGRSDILFCAGRGLLLLNAPDGFVPSESSGIDFAPGGVGPAFGDFDRDGDLDLFLPAAGLGRLLENDGRGHFHDVTTRLIGVALGASGAATSAAWSDIDADGWLDLVVTCLRAPNRVLFNRGGAAFEDGSRALGLDQQVFNSEAICLADFDGDADLDFALANEGRSSCILFSSLAQELKAAPVDVVLSQTPAATGSRLRILALGPEEKLALETELGGVQGRGCQSPARARVGLSAGHYRVEVRDSAGRVEKQEFTVEGSATQVNLSGAEAGDG